MPSEPQRFGVSTTTGTDTLCEIRVETRHPRRDGVPRIPIARERCRALAHAVARRGIVGQRRAARPRSPARSARPRNRSSSRLDLAPGTGARDDRPARRRRAIRPPTSRSSRSRSTAPWRRRPSGGPLVAAVNRADRVDVSDGCRTAAVSRSGTRPCSSGPASTRCIDRMRLRERRQTHRQADRAA